MHWNLKSISRFGVLAILCTAKVAIADPSTTSLEQGYDLGRVQDPRDMAFGGAQTAIGTSTTALYNNPANLPLAHVYHFEGLAAASPQARRQSYGLGVVDSSTSRLAGGLAATFNALDPDGIHRTWTDVRLGLGYPLGDRLAVGGVVRYIRANPGDYFGAARPSLVSDGLAAGPIFDDLTVNLGATLIPADGFRIGIVGQNLTNPRHRLRADDASRGRRLYLGALLARSRRDGELHDVQDRRWALHGRWRAVPWRPVPLRLGYRFDDGTRTHSVSGGLGYVDLKWSVEASVRHDVVSEHPATMIGLSVRFFYNAEGAGGAVTRRTEAF